MHSMCSGCINDICNTHSFSIYCFDCKTFIIQEILAIMDAITDRPTDVMINGFKSSIAPFQL